MEYIGTSDYDMGVIVKMGREEWETLSTLAVRLDLRRVPGTMVEWYPMFRLLDRLAAEIGEPSVNPPSFNGITVTIAKSVTVGSEKIVEE
jgi:hypothetical protein